MKLGEFELTDEILEKAKQAGSSEELLEMAKEYGIGLSEADAKSYFDFINTKGTIEEDGLRKLSTVEMEMVAGGKGGHKTPDPRFHVGQRVYYNHPNAGYISDTIVEIGDYSSEKGWCYYVTSNGHISYGIYLELPKYQAMPVYGT